MKNLILTALLIGAITTVNAQTDILETKKVDRDIKVTENGTVYDTKVKVITKKTQNTVMNPEQKYQVNQDRIASPITVEKTIMIDNDLDPFYDKTVTMKYYKYKGKTYNFSTDDRGLILAYKSGNKVINSTRAYRTKSNRFYIVSGTEFNGVGYFDQNKNFVVEYFNKVTNNTEYVVFENATM